MKKILVLAFLATFSLSFRTYTQTSIVSPGEYLGYELGSAFTPHYKVTGYLEAVANASPRAVLKPYGHTYEGRPLHVLFISSEENISSLEQIRQNNLKKAGLLPGAPEQDGKVIVWLSYNVHGDEASSTEAAMATANRLLNAGDTEIMNWLENTIVVIDACVNPDGRDRYVYWYTQNKSNMLLADQFSAEHIQGWPGGRMNHYLFDLNRDWTWLSQIESRNRMALYNEWLPQVHVDFHEQSYNSPYYFAPAAQPYHTLITDWQSEFQAEIGRNHAKYFDDNNWLYFTKERFDLFYPGYGDTYPTFNGAIGMTYEQAGSGRAGLGIKTETGDTLTLQDRFMHHYTTSLSTIEVSSVNARELEANFISYFQDARKVVSNGYNTFIVKNSNGNKKIRKLLDLLDRHRIQYGQLSASRSVKGFDYHQNRNVSATIDPSDLIIPVQQPKSVLLRVLFEPVSTLEDSLTYDITSWSIPFAFGLETLATTQVINYDTDGFQGQSDVALPTSGKAYGYAFTRKSIPDFKLLSELLKRGLNVRINYSAVESGNIHLPEGSFFILSGDNTHFTEDLGKVMSELSEAHAIQIHTLSSGLSGEGPDLGSSKLKLLNKDLAVGVLFGENVWPYNAGEVWHLFEQELHYPLIRLNTNVFNRIDLSELDVLIVPQGYYGNILNEDGLTRLSSWVSNGGRLVLMGSALRYFADGDSFNLKTFLDEEEKEEIAKLQDQVDYFRRYEEDERLNIRDRIQGGIYKARLDNSHPVGFGFPEYYFTLKTREDRYAVLDGGWNVASISGPEDKVSGFSGKNAQAWIYRSLVVGVEDKGSGHIVYFVDNPLFRSFWEGGKLLFCNAVFMP